MVYSRFFVSAVATAAAPRGLRVYWKKGLLLLEGWRVIREMETWVQRGKGGWGRVAEMGLVGVGLTPLGLVRFERGE